MKGPGFISTSSQTRIIRLLTLPQCTYLSFINVASTWASQPQRPSSPCEGILLSVDPYEENGLTQRKSQFGGTLSPVTCIHLSLRKYFMPERETKEVEFSHRDMHRSNLGSRTLSSAWLSLYLAPNNKAL
jgi:hypothetical protein